MGAAVQQNGGGNGRRRGRRRGRAQPMAEINVTPFVDVMLVLLIIFMVAAPLLTVGVEVDLPETSAGPVNVETQPITLTINKDGKLFIQETEIGLTELTPRLAAIAETRDKFETRIFIRGDAASPYEVIAKVLGQVSAAGYKKFTMTSLPQQ